MTKFFRIYIIIGIFAFVYSQLAFSKAVVKELVLTDSSKVTFLAVGKPGFLKINGEDGKATGKIIFNDKAVKGIIHVKLADFTTSITMRDKHMKEKYLEVEKYPEAILTLLKVGEIDKFYSSPNISKEVNFEGKLNLHGVEKPVSGKADINKNGNMVKFDAHFKIKVSDFNIDIPTYAGITVADEVEVTIKQEASLK